MSNSLSINKSLLINLIFILILSILPLLGFMINATSMAAGILIFSFLIYIVNIKHWNYLFHIKKKFIFLIILFLLYLMITSIITNNFLNFKAYLSLLGLFFVFGATYLISYVMKNVKDESLYKTIKYTFIIFLILGFYHIVFIGGAKNIFPFSEASHYALFLGPFSIVLYILSTSKILKLTVILVLILVGILFPNTTILMYAFLIFMLYIKLSLKNIFFIILGGIIFFNIILTNKYFSERIFFWNEQSSKNLSSLVYLQGVQDAYYSLKSTNGFGIGFQQLGTQKPSEAGIILQQLMDNENGLNRQDGGFTSAKIIAEMGYLGFLLLFIYFILLKKSFIYILNYLDNKERNIKLVIAYGFIYAYLIELFVRGAGYFTQGSFIFFISCAYLFINNGDSTYENNL